MSIQCWLLMHQSVFINNTRKSCITLDKDHNGLSLDTPDKGNNITIHINSRVRVIIVASFQMQTDEFKLT